MIAKIYKVMRAAPYTLRFAIAIAIVFAMGHLLGARDLVSVVSGTPVDGIDFALAAPIGMFYVLAWLALVVLAPILAIAGVIQIAARRALGD